MLDAGPQKNGWKCCKQKFSKVVHFLNHHVLISSYLEEQKNWQVIRSKGKVTISMEYRVMG